MLVLSVVQSRAGRLQQREVLAIGMQLPMSWRLNLCCSQVAGRSSYLGGHSSQLPSPGSVPHQSEVTLTPSQREGVREVVIVPGPRC